VDCHPSDAYLGLGSNLGDRLTSMQSVVRALLQHPRIAVDLDGGVASLYETSPTGKAAGQQWFLNSTVRVVTHLSPDALLSEVMSIEAVLGRVRPDRSGARAIDIDVLLFADVVMGDGRLTIPHPRMHQRRFVLEPLSEIASNVVHPVLGVTVAAMCNRLRDQHPEQIAVRIADQTWHCAPATASPTRIASQREPAYAPQQASCRLQIGDARKGA